MSDVRTEVIELLYGGGGDELISKMEPTQSDLATTDRKKRLATAGLSAVGATAGALGLGYAGLKMHEAGAPAMKLARAGGAGRLKALGTGIKTAAKKEKFATALLPAEAVGLGGEIASTKILHGDTKKNQPPKGQFGKSNEPDLMNNAGKFIPTKRNMTRALLTSSKANDAATTTVRRGKGYLKGLPKSTGTADVAKNDEIDVTWDAEISKALPDKQQIFGWASVVEVDGQPIVDLQGDVISPDEMEKAAYTYVMKSRKGGDMHLRNEWQPIQKSDMIESFIVTKEKREAMGLPDSMPTGWWVGFQVQDPTVWDDIKSGRRTGFSIHGHGH